MHLISHGLNDRGSWLLVALLLFGALALWANLKRELGIIDSCLKPAVLNGVVNCEGNGHAAVGLSMLLGAKIDLNSATVQELKQIPRLSTKVASGIIAKRMNLGSFSSYDQIDEIKGVGLKTLATLKAHTTLGNRG